MSGQVRQYLFNISCLITLSFLLCLILSENTSALSCSGKTEIIYVKGSGQHDLVSNVVVTDATGVVRSHFLPMLKKL